MLDAVERPHQALQLEAVVPVVEPVVNEVHVLLVQLRLERLHEAVDVQVRVHPDVQLDLLLILCRIADNCTQVETVEEVELHDAEIDSGAEAEAVLEVVVVRLALGVLLVLDRQEEGALRAEQLLGAEEAVELALGEAADRVD